MASSTPLRLAALVGAACALACAGAPSDTPAALCARAVGLYLGLPNPVAVKAEQPGAAAGEVEIRYESFNAENIPVEGRALCALRAGPGGSAALARAVVNGDELDADELAGVNRMLAVRSD